MAEVSHCYLCFDTLSCRIFKLKRSPLALTTIEDALMRKDRSLSKAMTLGGGSNGKLNGPTNGTNGHHKSKSTSPPARPLFVTWNILRLDERQLRGCIGTFEDQPLETGLKSYAITSAFDDTRFNPMDKKELPHLECGVSILTDFEPVQDPLDWTVGVHGLRISFTYHGRHLGATYLPDVPPEQGWTKEETLQSLMRKAGWSGRKAEWHKIKLSVIRYRGTKAHVTYEEYQELIKFMEDEQSGRSVTQEPEHDEDDEECDSDGRI